jgi:uncharacterized protein
MARGPNAPEQRTIDVDVEDIDTRGRAVVGYAAVYGARAQLDGFTEENAPGAFAGVLEGDVRALLNHDPNIVLGRTKSGTLRLSDEQRGLRFELDLPESRADLREAIARGDLDGASFRFKVGEDRWDGDHRTVTRVAELKDITLATYPAYPAASIELRTRLEAQVQEQETEQRDDGREQRPPAGSLRVEERSELPLFRSLADLYVERGFFENRTAEIGWDEYRTVWSGGTVLTDLAPVRREGVGLGYDTRWLYPVLPQTAVSDATTAVQYLRQSGRTLAGTAVIRPLDSVSTKPSVAGTAELVSAQLQQVAAIHPDVPTSTRRSRSSSRSSRRI